jgi:hypothetical protein
MVWTFCCLKNLKRLVTAVVGVAGASFWKRTSTQGTV